MSTAIRNVKMDTLSMADCSLDISEHLSSPQKIPINKNPFLKPKELLKGLNTPKKKRALASRSNNSIPTSPPQTSRQKTLEERKSRETTESKPAEIEDSCEEQSDSKDKIHEYQVMQFNEVSLNSVDEALNHITDEDSEKMPSLAN